MRLLSVDSGTFGTLAVQLSGIYGKEGEGEGGVREKEECPLEI